MTPREPLALYHSWPLWEEDTRFDLGRLHDVTWARERHEAPTVPRGMWRCDLPTGSLFWSPEVHGLFGIPAHERATRDDALAIYAEESRAALERLRTYALRHRRGFTLDVLLRPHGARDRWVRINAVPRLADGEAVELYGTKHDVTAAYR